MTRTPVRRMRSTVAVGTCVTLLGLTGCSLGAAEAAETTPLVGLITKTADNPYFQALRAGAEQEGTALGVDVRSYAGTSDSDSQTQIDAIGELVDDGASGILITPSGADVLPAIAQARAAGLLVIALDSPTDPADAVDATFATNNFEAGRSVGQWALGQVDPATARIAMLDLAADAPPVDVARDQGFFAGFGIDLVDPAVIGDETDPRIVGHAVSEGSQDGGAAAMTQLLAVDPEINLVYTINEPAAAGAYSVLQAAGLAEDVVIVSVDGGCGGIQSVQAGQIGATAMQFPLRMARLGIDAVLDHALTGDVPAASPGLDFFDTGSQLITDQPVDGLYSRDTSWATEHCWG